MHLRFNQKVSLHKLLVFLLFLLFLASYAKSSLGSQLQVKGNGTSIATNSSAFSESNFTDFGVVFNEDVSVSANQLQRTFVLTNTGSTALVISDIKLEDEKNFFNITTNAVGTLNPNDSANLTINFNSHAFGLAFAEVVIESNDPNGPFRFFIKANNIECNSFKCFGKSPDDPTVCNGKGQCLAQNVCSCQSLYVGTNCQTPVRWSDGTTVAKASFDFTPRIFIGPELTDPNEVYQIKIRIDSKTIFPGTKGISIAVFSSPPSDISHDLGQLPNEYGYISSTGQTFSNGVLDTYGSAYGVGDIILIEYDVPNNTLNYAVQKSGQSTFVPQGSGPAFIGLSPAAGKTLHLGLSVTCFGYCEFQFV